MCLQLFLHFPSLPQFSPLWFPCRFSLMLVSYEANKRWAAWHRVTPAIRSDGKTKRLHLFSLNSAPNPIPHHPSVSILFLWIVLKATQCLRISTCPPPLFSSTLNSVHPLPLPKTKALRSWRPKCKTYSLPVPWTHAHREKESGSSWVENSIEHARQYNGNSCETLEDHTMQKICKLSILLFDYIIF